MPRGVAQCSGPTLGLVLCSYLHLPPAVCVHQGYENLLRIVTSPTPFLYVHLMALLVFLFVFTFPFAFVGVLGVRTLPDAFSHFAHMCSLDVNAKSFRIVPMFLCLTHCRFPISMASLRFPIR